MHRAGSFEIGLRWVRERHACLGETCGESPQQRQNSIAGNARGHLPLHVDLELEEPQVLGGCDA